MFSAFFPSEFTSGCTCLELSIDFRCSYFLFRVSFDGVRSVPGSAASPTSEASAIQRLEASLAKVDASPASSPDISRSVSAPFDCLK